MKAWLFSLSLVLLASQCFGSVAIKTASLPNGIVGTSYSAAVSASGGCTPYKWSIASGALPARVTAAVSSTTTSLKLAGTPKTAASYSFTVQVSGCGGAVAKAAYKVAVQSGANHVVDLSWNASTSSDVTGYNVYRSPNKTSWKKVNASLIGSTVYTDSSVANGSTYYYAATAVDNSGQESSKTAAVKVVVP